MKRTLLLATLLTSGATFAQFTQANEPAIGDTKTYYLVDSNATNYASVTGNNVTWDYSNAGVETDNNLPLTKTMGIVVPSSTPNGSSFTTATKAVVLEDFITTYFASSTSSRNSKGFATSDYIVALSESNDELLMNYPFAYGASLSDNFSGTATPTSGGGLNAPTTGTINASVDGSGTLILNGSTTLTGVLRYKMVEVATANAGFFTITLTRTQYEYYHHSTSNLPVFIHSKIDISGGGAPTTQTFVLNSVQPGGFANLGENVLSGVAVYPNPAKETVFVSGLEDAAVLTLVDAQGKVITTVSADAGVASVNIADVTAGVYLLNIKTSKGAKTERVVVR